MFDGQCARGCGAQVVHRVPKMYAVVVPTACEGERMQRCAHGARTRFRVFRSQSRSGQGCAALYGERIEQRVSKQDARRLTDGS